ncbi:sensor histidine kinase [Halomonas halocynthiae]|uniref:sensor histidine kinase n=1 Tax=Halomonas halocynthiae TaxID=176290 RepID=UPI0004038424|nr:sensor histidine kinase [Halomonas halocynthiae]
MGSEWNVLIVAFGYLGLLFIIAAWADKRAAQRRSVISSPTVHALSIAVYCTAWTFYGSVGRAAEAGPGFLLIYLGPTLAMLLSPIIVRKMVRIAQAQRITSIADFISARYGKSSSLGALVAIIALIGITPYIALQLRAITESHAILTGRSDYPILMEAGRFWSDQSFWVALVLAVFIILFGARHLDASQRHEGMVAAVAFESLIKLAAFLAVGLFTLFVLFDGPNDLFSQVAATPSLAERLGLDAVPGGASGWIGMLVLAFLAFLTLPRQFQVLVVENVDERHINRAAWMFPLYLLAINIMVVPIAMAGLLLNSGSNPDSFVLTLPLGAGAQALSVFVFIGGLSAATGMMIVETIALSTMVSNQLAMPILLRSRWLRDAGSGVLARWLLAIRRLSIIGILMLGYAYHALIGNAYSLVTIGLVSFAAVAQFAPALLIGLYWPGANRWGVGCGMLAGILVWAWTLLIPGFARSGWLDDSFVEFGPYAIEWLRPQALFWLEGMDIYSHSLLWSLGSNLALLFGISMFTQASPLERTQAALFTGAMAPQLGPNLLPRGKTPTGALRTLLERYLGGEAARRVFTDHTVHNDSDTAAPELIERTEQALAGALGNASARVLVDSVVHGEAPDLDTLLGMLDSTQRILAMNRRLEQKSHELEEISAELRSANERLLELDRLKDEFVAMVSHELRTPLTSIRAFAEILRDSPNLPDEKRSHFLDVTVRESERLSRLIEEVLDLARLESGRLTLNPQHVDLVGLVHHSVDALSALHKTPNLQLDVDIHLPNAAVIGDPDRLEQVIINLLGNAVKFSNDAQPHIRLFLEQDQRGYRLGVEDNGVGISEDERERVFEKFHQIQYQEDGTVRPRPRGSGLGLPISRGIVAQLGGRLKVEDAPTLPGACLVMELPAAPSESTALKPTL